MVRNVVVKPRDRDSFYYVYISKSLVKNCSVNLIILWEHYLPRFFKLFLSVEKHGVFPVFLWEKGKDKKKK